MAGSILGIVPIAQSVALAADNVGFAKKKNKDAGDFMGQGVKNIVGASLIGETANVIGSF